MKITKRLIPFLLSLCVLISSLSIVGFANTNTTATEKLENSKNFSEAIEATLVSETKIENGRQFRIAIPSNNKLSTSNSNTLNAKAAVSINYIDVSISGSGGKIIGKVWHLGTVPTHNLEIGLYAGDTSASKKITSVETTNIAAFPFSTKVETIPTSSNFWGVKITGTMGGQPFYYSTYDFLFNKKAVEYPDLYDFFTSSIHMTVPWTASWTKVSNPLSTLSSTQVAAYRKWYENTYHDGDSLNWTNIQIHHIRPRAYGGTHDYSNLMPLHSTTHTQITTWWANY